MLDDRMLREVNVRDAIGLVLAHDLTQILPGAFKGRLFKKGHVIREQDIEQLLDIGKEHIYILNLQQGYIHEDEAALRMAEAICGNHLSLTDPHEGKVSLVSNIHGLAKVHRDFVDDANKLDQVVVSTLKNNTVVKPRQAVVGTRVIPLVVKNDVVCKIESLALQWKQSSPEHQIVSVKSFAPLK